MRVGLLGDMGQMLTGAGGRLLQDTGIFMREGLPLVTGRLGGTNSEVEICRNVRAAAGAAD